MLTLWTLKYLSCRSFLLYTLYNLQVTFVISLLPTEYGGFCAKLGPCRKSRSLQSYWNPKRKMGVATHFFKIISLESQQKCWHQHFSEKRKKQYFFTNFHRIHLHLQKSKHIYKDLKTTLQMVTKNNFETFLKTKLLQQGIIKASMSK